MAYSLQQVVSDGSLNRITVSIDYIDKANISVYVDDIILPDGTYTWVWDGEDAVITPNVANASVVVIKRNTKFDLPYHDFSAGAVFKDSSIDENFRQMLFIAQEAAEGATATDFYQDLNFHGYRLMKVGAAVEDDDAVPFAQYRADALGAFQQRVLAQTAATTAVASQSAAAASQSAAASSASSAASSASSASTSASSANASATNATSSASSASVSASSASTSATNAAASAAAAAASAASINDASLVHKAGTETITGAKTFSVAPTVPNGSAAGDAVNKGQLDAKVSLTGNESISGIKTFTSSPLLPGNATTALQAVPKQQLDSAIAGIPVFGRQEFLASGNFTVPAGVTSVYLSGIGGGGGGASSGNIAGGAGVGGQAGQSCIRKQISVTPGQVIAVTIGSGGASISSGGATLFGALLTLNGGLGVAAVMSRTATGGTIRGFCGQSSPFGLGGACATGSSSGAGLAADANTGAGGGGGMTVNTTQYNGGAGGSGYLLVEWGG